MAVTVQCNMTSGWSGTTPVIPDCPDHGRQQYYDELPVNTKVYMFLGA